MSKVAASEVASEKNIEGKGPDAVQNQNYKTIFGAPEGHDARVLADVARGLMADDGVLVHVALGEHRISMLEELLAFFAPDVQVISFPAWDCLPYDRVSPHTDVVAKRVAALSRLLAWKKEKKRYPRIVLTTVNAATQRVTPSSVLEDNVFEARAGGRLDVKKMQHYMHRGGYHRTETVREVW